MQTWTRRRSEFLADELTIAVMAKAIRDVDFADEDARNTAYRNAGVPFEKSCGLDDDAVHVARLYRDHVARPRAAREAMSCVFAAALLLPSIAQAAPVFTAEGTAAVASLSEWVWWAFTHVVAALAGMLVLAIFVAGASSDSDAVRQHDDDAQMSADWRRQNPRELGR